MQIANTLDYFSIIYNTYFQYNTKKLNFEFLVELIIIVNSGTIGKFKQAHFNIYVIL